MKLVGSILKVVKNFKTEMEAIQFFIKQRWENKVECPFGTCFSESKIYNLKSGKDFKCSCCGKIFSYKTRTIFEDTKIPMRKWFMAIYLIVNHKKGISSLQLSRDIDVTQKTAWFMLYRIRNAIDNEFHIVFENKMHKYHEHSDDILNKIRVFYLQKIKQL